MLSQLSKDGDLNLSNVHHFVLDECDKMLEALGASARAPARSLARVTLRLRGGKTHSAEVDRTERGRYLHPTDADIEDKFRAICTSILGNEKTDRVVELNKKLEHLPQVTEIIDALRIVKNK